MGPSGMTEDLPLLDREFSGGKRSVCLKFDTEDGRLKLKGLLMSADVFIEG